MNVDIFGERGILFSYYRGVFGYRSFLMKGMEVGGEIIVWGMIR